MTAHPPTIPQSVPKGRSGSMRMLVELWRGALSPIVRGGACGCCSTPGITLKPDWLEADILDYLNTSYVVGGDHVLRNMLQQRLLQQQRNQERDPFLKWIADLEAEGLPTESAERLREDVIGILGGLSHAQAKRL